jgi:hypothetical protein
MIQEGGSRGRNYAITLDNCNVNISASARTLLEGRRRV